MQNLRIISGLVNVSVASDHLLLLIAVGTGVLVLMLAILLVVAIRYLGGMSATSHYNARTAISGETKSTCYLDIDEDLMTSMVREPLPGLSDRAENFISPREKS